MTKNEARLCVMDNYHIVTQGCDRGLCGRDRDADAFEDALDLLLEPPTIAQSIRDAAINWPQYLGDVECQIIDSFVGTYERSRWRPNSVMFAESINTARTFMLFVAEALE